MSKDPSYSDSRIDRQGSRLRSVQRALDQALEDNRKLKEFNRHFGTADKLYCGDVLLENLAVRQRVAEIAIVVEKLDEIDKDWLLDVLRAPIFTGRKK